MAAAAQRPEPKVEPQMVTRAPQMVTRAPQMVARPPQMVSGAPICGP